MTEWLMRPVRVYDGPLDTPCILWTGGKSDNGYGATTWCGRTLGVHRVVFYLANGRWPEVCRHRCDVRACTNSKHLEDGTQADNMRDMCKRGRSTRGRSANAKLSPETVRLIRLWAHSGRAPQHIADDLGVGRTTVRHVLSGRSWGHVE